ncbi:hypothetical protein BACCAP_03648 [Pseudoflavonifractor capillosus ATCC 29799]|uniref:ABC-2 type transporter n=1 Tax=Pseudoflavonifractor capillosus ATCC 29799 TaxID=411467 RepID=A6NZJ7_9FIRM|nr:ABC transporter permease subunit [Pseudoflavonifractor capillosus]EDM98846.1 hypothetical protein BACCAP_03648 [Pseudoflavonifractor capillosus ATCC 29799]
MINLTLYKKELKSSWKLLVIIAGVLTLYITMIIGMFDPEMADALKQFEELMPEVMAAVGMTGTGDTLAGFMISYLYGMLMLVFPMVYTIIRSNGLVAKYVDRGSMASLLAAPVHRTTVALTQLAALFTGIFLLLAYCTALELATAQALFPGELAAAELLRLNVGLLFLQLFIGGFCFLCSCAFQDTRYSLAFGAGVPVLMYVVQMLANMGGKLENMKYATIFSLYQAEGLVSGESGAWLCAAILLAGAVLLSALAVTVFRRKDLHL